MAPQSKNYFTKKNILITGAGGGLGLALTGALLRRGARVLATDADSQKVTQLQKDPRCANGMLMAEQLDVRRSADFERCIDMLISNGDTLDVMINNAGLCAAGEFVHLPDVFWTDALRVNLEGTLNGCRIAAGLMKDQGSGHIVNIASVSGLVPFPVTAPYNMSKAGIVALSRSLRMELAYRGISVTVACPGQLQTDMFQNLPTERIQKDVIQANNPFKPVAIDRAADIILRSIEKRKFMVIFPFYAKILWWAHRVFPDLVEGVFVRKMNSLGTSGNL